MFGRLISTLMGDQPQGKGKASNAKNKTSNSKSTANAKSAVKATAKAQGQRTSAKSEPSLFELYEQEQLSLTEQEVAEASAYLDKKDYLFYDYILGTSEAVSQVNDIERSILINVNKLLERPELALKYLPRLPESITRLMSLLDEPEFNLREFVGVVAKEPSLATHMIKIANSPMYNHSGSEVTELGHAFMLIGAAGVKQHVLMQFFKKLINIQPIYFKMFGAKVWEHSTSTADLAKLLAPNYNLNPEAAYVNGLVHDIGKIMIFRVMIDAFKSAAPGSKPNSMVFKKLLSEKSMQMSLVIVEKWEMPVSICTTILDLMNVAQHDPATEMGQVLCEANLLSELLMMHEESPLTLEQYQPLCQQARLRPDTINLLNTLLRKRSEARKDKPAEGR